MITTPLINDAQQWREVARELLAQEIFPENVIWIDQDDKQKNLFNHQLSLQADSKKKVNLIPRSFLALTEMIACHRSTDKWHLLYQVLWRLTHGERYLLEITVDPVVRQLALMQKQIRRDMHKMKAFVRFRCCQENGFDHYIAWYEPDHKITRLVAPFFKRRFGVQCWTIMTPDETVYWDKEKLQFSSELTYASLPKEDQIEDLWRTFYRAIFNPARIKLKAMRKEMPVRFWHNLPEANIISSMLQEAPQRVSDMLSHQEGLKNSAKNYFPSQDFSIASLHSAALHCQACPLYTQAKHLVFGQGIENAKLVFVGEQPGLDEDQQGKPFIGPAGKLLRQSLKTIGIDENKIYLTNAVKHFKHEIIAGKKLHKSPNINEIHACKPWLLAEITTIKPKLIICLGLSAAKSLINAGFHMNAQHGKWFSYNDSTFIMATYHPSAILRAVNETIEAALYEKFIDDLKIILPKLDSIS